MRLSRVCGNGELAAVLQALAVLAAAAPYPRLPPELLPRTLSVCIPSPPCPC